MKHFIKVRTLILSVDLIKCIYLDGSVMLVEYEDETFHIHFPSEFIAQEECSLVYEQLTNLNS